MKCKGSTTLEGGTLLQKKNRRIMVVWLRIVWTALSGDGEGVAGSLLAWARHCVD